MEETLLVRPNGDAPLEFERREQSLRDIVAVLFRRKGIVLGSFLFALAAAVWLYWKTPTFYESTSRVIVSRNQQESAYTSRSKPLLSWEEELTSEIETVRSGHIRERAQKILDGARTTGSAGQPLVLAPDQVDAVTEGKSSVIYIRYRDTDREAAREGARAVTKAYVEFRQQVRAVPEVERFFREEIETLREQLDEWELRRADYMMEESLARLPEERTSLIFLRQDAETKLNAVRADLAEQEAMVEVTRAQLRHPEIEPYAFGEASNNDDQIVFQLKKELVTQRTAYFASLGRYTEVHPEVRALKDRVELLENELRREVESYARHLEARVEVLKAVEESLLGTLQYTDSELSDYPSKEARLSSFDRVIEALRADYSALVDKQMTARIERSGTSDWNVMILQPAGRPQQLRTNDWVRLALIPGMSLLVGIALAFLLDGLDHSLKDATEVESYVNLPVLGSLGRLK